MHETARKGWLFLLTLVIWAASYRLVAELTLERSKNLSLATSLDTTLPLIPEMTLIYVSIYLMWLPLVFSSAINYDYFKHTVTATYLVLGLLYIFYFAMPSSYPRPPIFDCACWRHTPLNILYEVDLPNNTSPSSHAAGVAILLVATWGKFKLLSSILFKLWGSSIIVSTVAIKQHYLQDAIASALLGLTIGYAFLFAKNKTLNSA